MTTISRRHSIIECSGYKFQKLEKLGEGTYGVVYKAKDMNTKQIVALKKIRPSSDEDDFGMSTTTIREIAVLKELSKYKNIVTLYDVLFHHKKNNLYLIFEFLDCDLKKYINKYSKEGLSSSTIKYITFQILSGISSCHSSHIFHRDLKPQNILINESTKEIKIADFGLSRRFTIPNRDWTHEVITLWYRAPEVLLGDDNYSIYVDIWSIGCIFAEIVNKSMPLFRGDSEICQLLHIFKICGTPNTFNWNNIDKLRFYHNKFPKWNAKPIEEVVPNLEMLGQDLFQRMLCLDPENRISAKQSLRHPYFIGMVTK